jgi:CBS domain-containing protein
MDSLCGDDTPSIPQRESPQGAGRGVLAEKGTQVLTVSPETRVYGALALMAEAECRGAYRRRRWQAVGDILRTGLCQNGHPPV